ncbi:MAG: hypothetical protein V7676_12380 [Parasphingorhabdus sp.]|uniref:hypothetical protein n=1 Tax=Parasphingorhabdus sp. TaxID=2709688 RepID=UPI0030028540
MIKMKISWFYHGMLTLLFAAAPASAQLRTPPVPGCQYAYGNIYGSVDGERAGEPMRTYDGSKITSPEQLAGYSQAAGDRTILIEGGNFSAWNFTGVKLSNICFVESDLSQSNWSGMTAPGLGFIKSNVEAANMSDAKMSDILIRSSVFARVDAIGTDWTSGKLDGGWDGDVEGLNIDGADLTGFKFDCGITVSDGCPLTRNGISARGAKLAFADISSFGFYDADMTGAILNQTVISPRQLIDFKDASNMGAVFLSGGDKKVMVLPETWAVLMASALGAKADDVPSFDCAKAGTKIEKEICGPYNSSIRQSDRQMGVLYKAARKQGTDVLASQKTWLKQRNACAAQEYPADCLYQAYDRRVGKLIGMLGEPAWLKSGEEALFVEEVLPLTADIIQSQSYTQLVPMLVAASRSSVLIKRSADGSIEARGDAVGANAHLCSISVKGLHFDRATGWYGLSEVKNDGTRNFPVLRYYDGRIEIYKGGKLLGDDDSPMMDYVSCGARASFPDMVRMAVSPETLELYRRDTEDY